MRTDELSDAEHAFVINSQLSGLLSVNDQTDHVTITAASLSMQHVVNAILQPTHAQSEATLARVNTSTVYRSWYKMVLLSVARLQSPAQAAASTRKNYQLKRQGQGFNLQITPEPNLLDQAYLSLQLDSVTELQIKRGIFLHCELTEQFYTLHLTQTNNQRFQKILITSGKVYKALMDGESHLYVT